MKYATLDAGVSAYLAFLTEKYISFLNRGALGTTEVREKMAAEYIESLKVKKGKKYIKIISDGSATAFIVAKDDGKFKAGDLLKAASWAAPAKNAARGNVLEGKFSGDWTGPAYMK
jgi:hypothetical protein